MKRHRRCMLLVAEVESRMVARHKETVLTISPLLNLHFFNICRHHPTLKFKPHATDDERYVSGIDGVPLSGAKPTLRAHLNRSTRHK